MSTPQSLPPNPAVKAALVAVPVALVIVAGLEAVRIPSGELFAAAARPLQAMLLALRGAIVLLWGPVLFQLYVAALAGSARPRRPWANLVLAALLSAAVTAWVWSVLAEYPAFQAYAPLLALLSVLWLYLGAWILWMRSGLDGLGPRLERLARWGFPTLGLGGFVATTALNQTLFLESYPPLHEAMIGVSYLLLHAGLAGLWLALPRVARPRPAWRWAGAAGLAVVVHLFLLTFPLTESGWCDQARPSVRRYTDLGRAESRRRPTPLPGAVANAAPKAQLFERNLLDDPDALDRFRKRSNLPALPPAFRLGDHNVLIVGVEALRFRETGLSGSKLGLTPHLAAFARSGGPFWFSRAYSPAPGTLQSMSSIFTATYPAFAPLRLSTRWHGRLHEKATTAAELFRRAGYQTFYAGHNFKEHFSPGGRIQGLHQGFAELNLAPGKRKDRRDPRLDIKILALAVDALERHRKQNKPFFGWVFFESPHYPYLDRYQEMPGESALQRYRQEIRFVDERLGELFTYLDLHRLREKTVVLFFSDHGEAFGEHRRRGHSDVYSEVTHVPLVVHVPGMKGSRIDGPTSLTYLFPWLFLRGTGPMRSFAEERLRKHIGPLMLQTEGAVVTEMKCPRCDRASLVYPSHRVVLDFPSEYVELYDLRTDPGEYHNIFSPKDPVSQVYQRRLERYLMVRAAHGALPRQAPRRSSPRASSGNPKQRAR